MKEGAWYRIFPEAQHANVRAVLAANRFGDRFEKISQILGRASADEVRRLSDAYNTICEEAQATCAERDGAERTLRAMGKRFTLYVNSATPLEPLLRIVKRRGWEPLFAGVYGRPASKVENLRAISKAPGEVAFVGDMTQDRDAAREYGCRFFGLLSPESDLGEGFRTLAEIEGAIDAER